MNQWVSDYVSRRKRGTLDDGTHILQPLLQLALTRSELDREVWRLSLAPLFLLDIAFSSSAPPPLNDKEATIANCFRGLGLDPDPGFAAPYRTALFPQARDDVPQLQEWSGAWSASLQVSRLGGQHIRWARRCFAAAFMSSGLFLIKAGHLGGCKSSCLGDRIAHTIGHVRPVLLRKQGPFYRLVGEC